MKALITLFVLTLSYQVSFSQDEFQNALISLNSELEFKPTSDSYISNEKPNQSFVEKFKNCAELKKLDRLNELDFGDIRSVKSSELYTSKWKGKWQIEFREWVFVNEEHATKFVDILESSNQSHIQFCVNKGGIMWWRDNDKVYIVTSRAYFVTYHYKEIKSAIIKGLKK